MSKKERMKCIVSIGDSKDCREIVSATFSSKKEEKIVMGKILKAFVGVKNVHVPRMSPQEAQEVQKIREDLNQYNKQLGFSEKDASALAKLMTSGFRD